MVPTLQRVGDARLFENFFLHVVAVWGQLPASSAGLDRDHLARNARFAGIVNRVSQMDVGDISLLECATLGVTGKRTRVRR
jgi:hypothetical protein